MAKQDSEIESYKQHCTKQIEMIKRNHEIEKNKKVLKIAKLKEEIQELQNYTASNGSFISRCNDARCDDT